MRRRRLLSVVTGVLVLVLATAGPAAAHATLETTSPIEGAVLAAAPTEATATFDEAVGVSPDSLRVFSPSGQRVDDGDTVRAANPDEIETRLRPGLAPGTYTVAWHVISADSHPVEGAYTFSIGAPSSTSVNAATLDAKASTLTGLLYGAARWLGYLGYSVLLGGAMFLAACWPGGAGSRRARRLMVGGWVGSMVSAAATILCQGVYAGGLPLNRALDPAVLSSTLDARFGRAVLARALLLVVVAPLLAFGVRRLGVLSRRGRLGFVCCAGGFGLVGAATWAGADHSSTGNQVPLAFSADLLHLGAMGIWLGGLAMLGLVVLRGQTEDAEVGEQALSAVQMFSNIAAGCVAALVVTGIYQAWRNIGTWAALTGTDYGHLVLYKAGGLVILVGLGWMARYWIAEVVAPEPKTAAATAPQPGKVVPARAEGGAVAPRTTVSVGGSGMRHPGRRTARVASPPRAVAGTRAGTRSGAGARAGARTGDRRSLFQSLRRSVALECAVAMLILVASSILVESAPGRLEAQGPTDATVAFNTGTASGSVLVVVSPGVLGLNQMHLYFSGTNGLPYSPVQVTATFTLASEGIGPLSGAVEPDGPGHFVDVPVSLGFRGTWTLAITVRSDDFDETTLYVPVPIG